VATSGLPTAVACRLFSSTKSVTFLDWKLWRATAGWNVVRHKMLATQRALATLVVRRKRDAAARAQGLKTLVALELGYLRTYAGREFDAAAEAEMQYKAELYLKKGAPKALPEENDRVSKSQNARQALREAYAAFVAPSAKSEL